MGLEYIFSQRSLEPLQLIFVNAFKLLYLIPQPDIQEAPLQISPSKKCCFLHYPTRALCSYCIGLTFPSSPQYTPASMSLSSILTPFMPSLSLLFLQLNLMYVLL